MSGDWLFRAAPDAARDRRQVKTKGSRRVTFEQFLTALAAVADAKKTSLEAVVRQVLGSQGPVSSGTRAEYVKFHDDKVGRGVRTPLGVLINSSPTRHCSDPQAQLLRLNSASADPEALSFVSRGSMQATVPCGIIRATCRRVSTASLSTVHDDGTSVRHECRAVDVHGRVRARRPQRGAVQRRRSTALPGS